MDPAVVDSRGLRAGGDLDGCVQRLGQRRIGRHQPRLSRAHATTRSGSGKYERIWRSFRPSERRWANRTAECESGRNPRAIGGGGMYRGAFQFMKSTWRASPRSPGGDPIAFSYRTQAVVAVLLMRRDGAGPGRSAASAGARRHASARAAADRVCPLLMPRPATLGDVGRPCRLCDERPLVRSVLSSSSLRATSPEGDDGRSRWMENA